MWRRQQGEKMANERTGVSDPMSAAIWEAGHLTGSGSVAPVINAPRAADLAASDAA
jgi:hypothetical protein